MYRNQFQTHKVPYACPTSLKLNLVNNIYGKHSINLMILIQERDKYWSHYNIKNI